MSPDDSSPPTRSVFPLMSFLVPAALLLAALAAFPVLRGVTSLAFPFQVDREEGFLLNQALCLSQGRTIYPSLDHYPYTVGNYPPVYPAVYAVCVKLLGPSLPIGRLVNLLAALGIAAGLVWTVRSQTGRMVPALLAPALFVCTWDFNQWIAYARVDFLALGFTLWGYRRFLERPESGGGWGAALLFALALFTRQTLFAAPLAALATLALQRKWRGFRTLLLWLAVFVGGAYALLILVTGGRAWSHLVTYNANPFHWDQVQVWARHLWRFQKFLLVAAGMAVVCLNYLEKWEGWRNRSGEERENGGNPSDVPTPPESESGAHHRNPAAADSLARRSQAGFLSPPLTLYLLLAFLSFLMVGKEGAAANYLLEFHMALALFLAIHLGRVYNLGVVGFRHPALGLLNVLLFLGVSFHAVYLLWARPVVFSEPPPGASERLAATEVLEALERFDGDVVSEEPIYAILAGRPVLFQPFIMSQLARQGVWDARPFVRDLRAGKFAALVTTQDVFREDQYFVGWTPDMREAIRKAYVEAAKIDHGPRWRYWVLRPKAAPTGEDRQNDKGL